MLFLAVPSCRHAFLAINYLPSYLNAEIVVEWCVDAPNQFRSAAADDACAESSLFANTESKGNCFAALHSQKLRTKAG